MFHSVQPVILASSSPRRQELLRLSGISCVVRPALDEEKPRPGEPPVAYAVRAARGKAFSVGATRTGGAAILAADTIVVLNGHILGKPKDNVEALLMLRALSGIEHTVITACVLLVDGVEDAFHVESTVRMWQAPDEILATYAATEEPLDKAGGYALQGASGFLVHSITGSWSNVVGLPIAEVVQKLLFHKIIIPVHA